MVRLSGFPWITIPQRGGSDGAGVKAEDRLKNLLGEATEAA